MLAANHGSGDVQVFRVVAPHPYRVGLLYRVGAVDEALPRRGVSHFVEHLALSGLGPLDHPFNGFVSSNLTVFVSEGTADEVSGFATRLVSALEELPTERIDLERRVLLTEAASRGTSAAGELLFWRYGAQGFGVVGMEELGLHAVDAPRLQQWAQERFCPANAAMWIAGPDPEVVRTPDWSQALGSHWSVPDPTPVTEVLPGWGVSPLGGVHLGLVGERSMALTVGLEVLTERAQQRLRIEEGVAYAVGSDHEPLTGSLAHAVVAADCLPEHAQQAVDTLLATFERLRADGPSADELARVVRRRQSALEDAFAPLGEAVTAARDVLLEGPVVSLAEQAAMAARLTPEDIATALTGVEPFVLVPPATIVHSRDFTPSGQAAPQPVEGREHQPAATTPPEMANQRLLVGHDAISLSDDTHRITVKFETCAAVGAWDNGVRALYADDGTVLHFAPRDWQRAEQIERDLRASIRADRWVNLGGEPSYSGHDSHEGRRLRRRQGFYRIGDYALAALFYVGIPLLGVIGALVTESIGPLAVVVVVLAWQYWSNRGD